MEEAVRIGGDPRRSQCDQRTQLRGSALQRKFGEQAAVHVGMKRRIIFQKIARLALDRDGFGRTSYLESDLEADWHGGTNINVLRVRSEPGDGDTEMVRIEGNVRKAESSRAVGGD